MNQQRARSQATDNRGRFLTEEGRWQAVLERDPDAEGVFFYAVSTTGIFCRPGCPARRPERGHVRFFDTACAAVEAGYRACRRCRPDRLASEGERAGVMAEACRLIEDAEEALSLEQLASATGFSASHLRRTFKAATGLTPAAYGREVRAGRVRQALAKHRGSVTESIYEAGYSSSGRFYEEANAILGMTPSRYQTGGGGERIYYAVRACELGRVLVAATEKGICAILLGDEPESLISELRARFPNAERLGGNVSFNHWVDAVLGALEKPREEWTLPLDLRGTAFQRRVWNALRKVPVGETTSYRDVARGLGMPHGSRAVARACGANPVAVAVPCHRVLRSDGSLSGYRWGIERKRRLLEREGIEL